MEDWYFMRDGSRFGPISGRQLRKLALSGQLQPSDQLWRDGMPAWISGSTLPGLFAPMTLASPRVEAQPQPMQSDEGSLAALALAVSKRPNTAARHKSPIRKGRNSRKLSVVTIAAVGVGIVGLTVYLCRPRQGGKEAGDAAKQTSPGERTETPNNLFAPPEQRVISEARVDHGDLGIAVFHDDELQVYFLPPLRQEDAYVAAAILREAHFRGMVQFRVNQDGYEVRYHVTKGENIHAAVVKLDTVVPRLANDAFKRKPMALHLCNDGFETSLIVSANIKQPAENSKSNTEEDESIRDSLLKYADAAARQTSKLKRIDENVKAYTALGDYTRAAAAGEEGDKVFSDTNPDQTIKNLSLEYLKNKDKANAARVLGKLLEDSSISNDEKAELRDMRGMFRSQERE